MIKDDQGGLRRTLFGSVKWIISATRFWKIWKEVFFMLCSIVWSMLPSAENNILHSQCSWQYLKAPPGSWVGGESCFNSGHSVCANIVGTGSYIFGAWGFWFLSCPKKHPENGVINVVGDTFEDGASVLCSPACLFIPRAAGQVEYWVLWFFVDFCYWHSLGAQAPCFYLVPSLNSSHNRVVKWNLKLVLHVMLHPPLSYSSLV